MVISRLRLLKKKFLVVLKESKMSKNILVVFTLIVGFFVVNMLYAATLSPVGNWVQVGDESHQPESVIKIWQENNLLYGKVTKGFVVNGKKPEELCSHCTGKLYNQPIVGMKILWGFKQLQADQWGDGKILDPHSGKIYKCKMTLADNGQKLKVRGYIGFSLLGRTQVWSRS
jgi:uncharacterized protein (DUF2147 family)